MKRILAALVSAALLAACSSTQDGTATTSIPKKPNKQAKNVILMIGDGMGLTHISAGMYMNNNKLELERFPIVGIHKSYAADDLITDSAAGATAFASGIKTYNGAIGVNTDTLPVPTILEQAKGKGYATGLVATSTIVHATPASFLTHVKQRRMYEEIAGQFVDSGIDFFIGGGKKYFDRRESDERNVYQELEDAGYFMSDYFKEDLRKVKPDPSRSFGYFTADDDPLPKLNGRDYLIDASKKAAEFLRERGPDGFFLMIEGSQIDWGGHANNSDYIVSEMINFDEAVGKILDFAKRDGETLVVVTADHETGGYAINPGSTMGKLVPSFTSDYHTAALIPVFAYGPGAELFSGIYENTSIYDKMRAALGF